MVRTKSTLCYFLAVVLMLFSSLTAALADGQEQFSVNSPVNPLRASQVPPSQADPQEPYKSGTLNSSEVQTLIDRLLGRLPNGDDRVTIIHFLRWSDETHTKVKFQRWFVVDASQPFTGSFYVASTQSQLEGNVIRGKRKFRMIYVHLNSDSTKPEESIRKNPNSGDPEWVTNQPSYNIVITKQHTQLYKDFSTVLDILGFKGINIADADPVVGYYSTYDFDSSYSTSTVAITAKLLPDDKTLGAKDKAESNSNATVTKTYYNEKPAWVGLSFAVPLTSYKDLEYQQDATGLTPKSVTRENVYVTADFYLPPVDPSLKAFRYIPSPFFGVPIKKQPLRHTMLGLSIGLRWVQPFGAVVFDVQSVPTGIGIQTKNRLVMKGVWGLKVSVDAVQKALKK